LLASAVTEYAAKSPLAVVALAGYVSNPVWAFSLTYFATPDTAANV
jgi:hypothetical protein